MRRSPLFGQLLVDGFEDTLAHIGLDEVLLEYPDRSAVRHLAAGTQTDEKLEAELVEQLKFHFLVAQAERLLEAARVPHQLD